MASFVKNFQNGQLFKKCLKTSFDIIVRNRFKMNPKPKRRLPEWLPKPTHVRYDEELTQENKEFISNVVTSKLVQNSMLKPEIIRSDTEWTDRSMRTGLIGKKIGVYPMWLKNGKRVLSTLIQIVDNEVIKYIPPEEYTPVIRSQQTQIKRKKGCLVIGAQNIDPQLLTKEFYGLFSNAGVTPKRVVMRFHVTPDAALAPGTPLVAAHFRPGQYLDIRGKTIDRGFQGVMKRWGFKGMPASHGVTKSHRRGGNIGSGGTKARVMPGTKMPGHMGNRLRILKGVKILRINTKYNVIWVLGPNIPGETNTMCYLYDTILPLRRLTAPPNFPTYSPNSNEDELPENLYADEVHQFGDSTIQFTPES